MRHQIGTALLAGAAVLWASTPATAQAAADSALADCARAARAEDEDAARTAADRAERLFRARMAADPRSADARVGIARVIGECRIGFASFMSKARFSGQSVELLKEALAIDSTHWAARFALAMNYYHTPAFLGRTDDAVREFEHLVAQQGARTTPPVYAQPYLRLGELYARQRRFTAALAIWRLGAELFPQEARFAELIHQNQRRTEATDSSSSSVAAAASPPAAPRTPQRVVALEGITVQASANRLDDTRSGTALRRLDVLMTPGGTADLMQAIQTGPGITRAAEGSDLYVRGGDPAEAPVWVDGARLVYAGRHETLHGGAFGVLDPAVLGSATFSSGGFGARYGNALSGVLDVETLGRPEVAAGVASANTVGAGGMLQLPAGRKAGAWGAARVTEGSLMLAMHGRSQEFSVAPRALEGVGGVVWAPRPGWQFKATGLVDTDHSARTTSAYGHQGAFDARGSTRLVTVSGLGMGQGGRVAVRGNLSATERTSAFAYGVLDRERSDRGVAARLDTDWIVGGGRLRAGAEAAGMGARHTGVAPTTAQLAPGSPSQRLAARAEEASHLGGYAEYEWSPNGRLAVVAGIRADRLPGEDAWTTDPRLALALRAGDWTVRLAGGEFHQGRWRTRFAVPDRGSPAGTPTRARHLVVGAERTGEPSLKVEGYAKSYSHYAEAGAGPRIMAGQAGGLDAVVRWSKQSRVNGWVTYSLLRGRVELEDERVVPSAVDVTHSLTGVATIRLPHELQLGNTLRYASGRPFTTRSAGVSGPPNGSRLPEYLRIDSRLTRFWTVRGHMLVTYLEMLNTTDRANIAGYTHDDVTDRRTAVPTFFGTRTAVFGGSLNF